MLQTPSNYATHKTPKIKAWLARRPHYYHVHFTPTSASWINQIERWFAELTRKQIQRGVSTSIKQLEADIRTFIELHNNSPKPFKWTSPQTRLLASVKRFCHKAQQTLCGELYIHATSAVLHEFIRYCNAVPEEAGHIEGRTGDRLKNLNRKENAPIVSVEFLSAQKTTIPDEMIKRNNINMLSHRFCIAPMMDWSESSIFSIGYRAACARHVHREIEKNLIL